MGIRLESKMLPQPYEITTGQFSTVAGKRFNKLYIVLDGNGPGLGGHYFLRRQGLFGSGKVIEGSVNDGEHSDVIIFGRLCRFIGT